MDGATIGGIGVSGGNAPGRDDEIARAGLAAVESLAPATPAIHISDGMPQPAMQHSIFMSQPAISPYPQPPTPAHSPIPQPQSQVASSLSSSTPQINPANTHHLASNQENPFGDEQVSFDQFNEALGDQS
jgi:hypothetical protein